MRATVRAAAEAPVMIQAEPRKSSVYILTLLMARSCQSGTFPFRLEWLLHHFCLRTGSLKFLSKLVALSRQRVSLAPKTTEKENCSLNARSEFSRVSGVDRNPESDPPAVAGKTPLNREKPGGGPWCGGGAEQRRQEAVVTRAGVRNRCRALSGVRKASSVYF